MKLLVFAFTRLMASGLSQITRQQSVEKISSTRLIEPGIFDMRKKYVVLWLALAMLIAGTANAAKLARHYRFRNALNLGQATVGPDATFKSAITNIASPGGWAFKKVSYLQQTPASAAPDSQIGINAGALACWFKTTDTATSRQSIVFGTGTGVFLIDILAGGRIEAFVRDDRRHEGTELRSDPGLADDRWHHAAATWSGTGKAAIPGDSTLRLYIDGKLVGSKQDPVMSSVQVASWNIGARPTQMDQFPFDGYVSDVRIYAGGAVLNDTEVAALCDADWLERGFSTRRVRFDISPRQDTPVQADEYFVDMDRIRSATELEAVPGVKIAWKLPYKPFEWMANVGDVDGDGKIELFASGVKNGERFIFRYNQDGELVWISDAVNQPLGNESGMAIEDLDADGKHEIIFNVYRQLWCLDAGTGKTNWKIDLPESTNNHQVAVVGHFLDRERFAVVCRVNDNVFCYDPYGAEVWRYHIQNSSLYGHDMAHYDADGDGLDEIYMSLNRKFLALGGDGKLRWADNCGNHSDFILCGDVDGDGDCEIVYDSDGCSAMHGPIVCRDGRSGELVKKWIYDRPGEDHLQKATLGDFDPSWPGLELAAIGKRDHQGGLIVWNKEGKPAWRKENTGGWVTWGDWNGDGHPEILLSRKTAEKGAGFQVWTGAGKCLYAIEGIGGVPLGTETASRKRPDLDGNNKADVLLLDDADAGECIVLMEAP
jgi:outer membrane protein assembly factor BamB